MTDRAIADYGLLSDCHSAALVSGDGSVDWLCFPRFDSPSVFGRILDADAGHWSIRPVEEFDVRRRYLPGSLVLETQFTTAGGMVMVTDALVIPPDGAEDDLGAAAPHVLVRVAETTQGSVELAAEYAPRPEYGLVRPRLDTLHGTPPDTVVVTGGGADRLWLSGPVPDLVSGGQARWRILQHRGDRVGFALGHFVQGDPEPVPWPDEEIGGQLDRTVRAWRGWSARRRAQHVGWSLTQQSGLVVRGLTYQPTGAVISAPTTSLPEQAGGVRNWDHRYAWLRRTAPTVAALDATGSPADAIRFAEWILATTDTAGPRPHHVQAVYGAGGEHDLSERELTHLGGWKHSRPVRAGNASWEQFHTDTFGEVLDAVARVEDRIGTLSERTCALLAGLADSAATAWREPDAGLWDDRDELRHHVSSKLMCWVALDRAVRLAERISRVERSASWAAARDEIRATILDQGWNGHVGAFTQTLGGETLDASVLLLALTGFLPADDLRMRATIDTIASTLSAPCGLVHRFGGRAGPTGDAGIFVVCTYWLVQCLAATGDAARAVELFERATAYTNDLGLLSEVVDPATGDLLGNFPHGPAHVGLINAARALSVVVPAVETS